MSQGTPSISKEQILIAFSKLMAEVKKGESRVATKEEEFEKQKNKQLLAEASEYTVDNIVNSMASLQLDFSKIINELSERLTTESSKLEELRKAIGVQKDQVEELRKVRLVADALHLLRQEHQEKLRLLEEQTAQQREAIEKEMTQTRKAWEKEQQEFDIKVAESAQLATQKRELEAADYQYHVKRDRKIETDEYEEKKRQQETELLQLNKQKEKGWKEQEKMLTDNENEFQENQKKIANFEEKVKEEYNKTKVEAIKDADREAKIRSDLFEKDWELSKQGCDLTIQSLETAITQNNEQIADLTAQLQAATTQAQNLAMRAFQTNGTGSKVA